MLGLEVHCMGLVVIWVFIWGLFGGMLAVAIFSEMGWKVGSVVLVILILAIGIPIFSIVPAQWERIDTWNIVSISDSSSIHGSFMIGAGYIDSEPVFITYGKTADGGYKLLRFYASRSTVYMDENDNPRVDTLTTECQDIKYEIHVPEGTIVREFVLDGRL